MPLLNVVYDIAAPSGDYVLEYLTVTPAEQWEATTSGFSIAGPTTVTVRVDVKLMVPKPTSSYFYFAANDDIFPVREHLEITNSDWVTITEVFDIPEGAILTSVNCIVSSTSEAAVGANMRLDRFSLREGSAAATEDYFDGSSPGAHWTGKEHLSASQRLPSSEGGFPFKRWLHGMTDIMASVETTVNRIDYYDPDDGGTSTDTSDLGNPDTANNSWLDWMAQLVGGHLEPGMSVQGRRDAVRTASTGFKAGTKGAISAAASTVMIGTGQVEVYDHSISAPGDGGLWDVLLVANEADLPPGTDLVATVMAKNAKPAGVMLHHRGYSGTWDSIALDYPTWDDWEAAGSWTAIEAAGLE